MSFLAICSFYSSYRQKLGRQEALFPMSTIYSPELLFDKNLFRINEAEILACRRLLTKPHIHTGPHEHRQILTGCCPRNPVHTNYSHRSNTFSLSEGISPAASSSPAHVSPVQKVNSPTILPGKMMAIFMTWRYGEPLTSPMSGLASREMTALFS